MKYLILGVLASIWSGSVLADSQPAAKPPAAHTAREFDCGPDLRANVALRAMVPVGKQSAYNGIAAMKVNGTAADPTTLRFVNEKIAGRMIETLTKICQENAMDLVLTMPANGADADTLTVTVRGNMLTVH